jgi:N6-L-threonylcarbamoyladenine synthase
MVMTLVLAIESSCDDTSVAIVDDTRRIRANVVRSQIEVHAPYGGVVPEIAARNHIAAMEPVLQAALDEAGCSLSDIDLFAATAGPGLIGGVIVGLMTAKTLAAVHGKPLLAVNHLEGHALTVRLSDNTPYPYLLLLVSGGHCFYCHVKGLGDYTLLGGTIDDALGEAFDKCAKMMGLGYPGGPVIEKLAAQGNADAFDLPRPLMDREGCDLSFSGLKTAIRYTLQAQPELTGQVKADMAASFQKTACEILVEKTRRAYRMAAQNMPIVLAGGVAANSAIRGAMEALAEELDTHCVFPPVKLCTDNAAMIAIAALERFEAGETSPLTTEPRARWPLAS